jgi:16S rRNA (cytidine1402-2'-O)-methyltransferase
VITLAGTPLGNADDASARLGSLLATADVIAAEDTRRVRRLAKDLGIGLRAELISYFDANERVRATELVERAKSGEHIVVLTDAGMPTVSDPGYRIVREAIDSGIPVSCAPGPSAVTTALALSGLPCDRFCFEGFLPRKAGERLTYLQSLRGESRTMVFFEAPHRIAATLTAMRDVFGADRQVALCRELTKTYEEVIRGSIAEVWAAVDQGVRGEITLVVAGQARGDGVLGLETPADWVERVAEYFESGMDRRDAIADVAKEAGVSRRLVYAAVIASK